MAGTPSGLTTSIRRKLEDGKSPEEIVQELVAGGLTEVSAQRFVDQAVQYPAEEEPPAEKVGGKALWVACALMCGGIIISAASYIMADSGERYVMLFGPIVFGFLAWAKAVYDGREDGPDFAWRTAMITLALPIVLGGAAYGIAMATEPEESPLQAQMDQIFDPSKSPGSGDPTKITIKESAPPSQVPGVHELVSMFESNAGSPAIQCDIAQKLSEVPQEEKAIAAVSLMAQLGNTTPDGVKICIARAMKKLEPTMAMQIYGEWANGTNETLKAAALKDRP